MHAPSKVTIDRSLVAITKSVVSRRTTVVSRHLILISYPDFPHVALLILARRLEVCVLAGRPFSGLKVADDGESTEDNEAGREDAELGGRQLKQKMCTRETIRTKMTSPSATAMSSCGRSQRSTEERESETAERLENMSGLRERRP